VGTVGHSQAELVRRAGLQVRDYHRGHSGVKCKSLPVLAGQNRKDVFLHPSLQILQSWEQKKYSKRQDTLKVNLENQVL